MYKRNHAGFGIMFIPPRTKAFAPDPHGPAPAYSGPSRKALFFPVLNFNPGKDLYFVPSLASPSCNQASIRPGGQRKT
jgi:hypothetical protein